MSQNQILNHLRAIESQPRVGNVLQHSQLWSLPTTQEKKRPHRRSRRVTIFYILFGIVKLSQVNLKTEIRWGNILVHYSMDERHSALEFPREATTVSASNFQINPHCRRRSSLA